AAAGIEAAPRALARGALARRRIFRGDLVPIAFEFFGDQLSEPRQRALPHLGAGDADYDRVVRPYHHPGVDLRRAIGGANHGRSTKWEVESRARPAPAAAVPTTKARRSSCGI